MSCHVPSCYLQAPWWGAQGSEEHRDREPKGGDAGPSALAGTSFLTGVAWQPTEGKRGTWRWERQEKHRSQELQKPPVAPYSIQDESPNSEVILGALLSSLRSTAFLRHPTARYNQGHPSRRHHTVHTSQPLHGLLPHPWSICHQAFAALTTYLPYR